MNCILNSIQGTLAREFTAERGAAIQIQIQIQMQMQMQVQTKNKHITFYQFSHQSQHLCQYQLESDDTEDRIQLM